MLEFKVASESELVLSLARRTSLQKRMLHRGKLQTEGGH